MNSPMCGDVRRSRAIEEGANEGKTLKFGFFNTWITYSVTHGEFN